MQVTEPTTLLTDYALGALTAIFAGLLFRTWRLRADVSVALWAFALSAAALAAFTGGTFHGFTLYLGNLAAEILWKVTVYSIGVASFCMLAGSIVATVSRRLARWLLPAAVLKLALYAAWMTGHDDFRWVIYDYGLSMLAVLLLQTYAAYKLRMESSRWIIAGIAVSLVGAAVQQRGITLHQHFNHNDLYHVIQMAATYLLFRGARLSEDRMVKRR